MGANQQGSRDDVAAVLIDRHTSALKTGLGNGNLRAPGFAAILAAPGNHAVRSPCGNQRAIHRDNNVREPLVLENLLKLDRRLAKKWLKFSFVRAAVER